jgi:hypothetical protein
LLSDFLSFLAIFFQRIVFFELWITMSRSVSWLERESTSPICSPVLLLSSVLLTLFPD